MRVKQFRVALGSLIMLVTCAASQAAQVTYPSWQWGESANATLLNKLKAKFEKENPGDTLKGISVPYTSFFEKQYSEVRAGNPSDLVSMFEPDMASYLKQDLLEPLDKYLEMAGISADMLNSSHKVAIKDGHVYGIALQINPRALLVNKQLLTQAGLATPTNLDQFMAAIKKLRKPAAQQFGFYTISTSGTGQDLYLQIAPIVFGFGGSKAIRRPIDRRRSLP